MKKAYIIPEIQIYDADAENILAGTTKQNVTVDGGIEYGGDGEGSEGGALAKPGDFFCDNFEYELDIDF